MRVLKFIEFIKENDGGGGVAFATANGNGMGAIVAPTVGSVPGSVNQNGCGTIGSGDRASYDMGNHFGWKGDRFKKKKNRKRKYSTK